MWKILLRVLLQSNDYCREKHGWYISLQKLQVRAMVPNTPECCFKEKIRICDWHLTNSTNNQGKRHVETMYTTDRFGFKICEKLTQCAGAGNMWDNVTVLEEHMSSTPLYTPSSLSTPGKFWYTLGCTIQPVDKHGCSICYNLRFLHRIAFYGFLIRVSSGQDA